MDIKYIGDLCKINTNDINNMSDYCKEDLEFLSKYGIHELQDIDDKGNFIFYINIPSRSYIYEDNIEMAGINLAKKYKEFRLDFISKLTGLNIEDIKKFVTVKYRVISTEWTEEKYNILYNEIKSLL